VEAEARYCAAMSQENVEIVRRMLSAFERAGFEALGPFVHEDFEMRQLPSFPGAASYRGESAAKVMSSFSRSFEDFSIEFEEIIDAGGDQVVVSVSERGRPRGGSVELDQAFGILYRLRDRKLVRMEWFNSPEEALEAAGLSE
jgi:ketosteroid isomerase-like protein